MCVVVYDSPLAGLFVDERHLRVWPVALGVNAFIPIMKRRRIRLFVYYAGPWILAGRLIKVPVNDHCGRKFVDVRFHVTLAAGLHFQ